MLDSLRFVKYVRSFMDGRVRVRHPALRDAAIAGKARAALLRVDGVWDIELNTLSGSALILYEAQRQRQNAGMYERENSMLPDDVQQRLLFEGGYPVLARVAKRKGLPYPRVNLQGEVDADESWWATMQASR